MMIWLRNIIIILQNRFSNYHIIIDISLMCIRKPNNCWVCFYSVARTWSICLIDFSRPSKKIVSGNSGPCISPETAIRIEMCIRDSYQPYEIYYIAYLFTCQQFFVIFLYLFRFYLFLFIISTQKVRNP